MHAHVTDALLLRSVDYGDTDRIVTLLTTDFGRVACLARGARNSRRRFGAALSPFVLMRAELTLGRGELGRLVEVQVVRAYPAILADLEKLALAGAATRFVRELLPARAPEPAVFDLLVSLFEALNTRDKAHETHLLAFQLRLLAILGHAPELGVCGRCGRTAPDGRPVLFDPALGAVVCRACGGAPLRIDPSARAFLRAVMADPTAPPDTGLERDACDQVRRLIEGLLAHHLDRGLGAGEVLSQIEELMRRSDRPPPPPPPKDEPL